MAIRTDRAENMIVKIAVNIVFSQLSNMGLRKPYSRQKIKSGAVVVINRMVISASRLTKVAANNRKIAPPQTSTSAKPPFILT